MNQVVLSGRARVDVGRIARYSQREWGEAQAKKHIRELENALQLLAERPGLGRLHTSRSGERRMEQESHVIFYREEASRIFIRRILHKSMLPKRNGL